MSTEKVYAIILNYNSFSDTKKCIEHLKKQNYENLRIVVVDNASSDIAGRNSLKEFSLKDDSFKLILSNKNGGFSAGNNIGIKYALEEEAEWIMIINPDVELRDENYVFSVMKEKNHWKNVGVIGTRTIMPDGFNQNPLRELSAFEEIAYPITYLKEKKYGREYYKSKEETGYCEKLAGCCFFVSAEFLIKNNFLDESVFLYSEEPILAKSALKQGYKLLYIDEIIAYHQHFENSKPGNAKNRMIMALKSRKYYIKNYSGYNPVLSYLALLVKNIQIALWKVFK